MTTHPAGVREEVEYKYWAFISYSHKDRTVGDWLHKALESYRVPKFLHGRKTRSGAVPSRLYPIFRDREELAAAPDLGDRIEAALRQSRHLIVVCSPAGAASPWVDKEIAFFKSLGGEDRIFSLIVEGEPYSSERPGNETQECFPAALRYRAAEDGTISKQRAEPLAADAREGKDGRPNALLKLIAGMLAVNYDELRQRDLEARNARLRRVVGASVLAVVVFAGLAVYAFLQQRLAEERSRVALSRQLAVQSGSLLQTSPDLPLLLSLEALFAENTVEARQSLFNALMVTRRPITLVRPPGKMVVRGMAIAPDGEALVTAGREGELVFWDLATDPPKPQLEKTGVGINGVALSRDGKLLAAAHADGVVALWDMGSRQRLNDRSIPKQESEISAVAFGPGDVLAFGYSSEESLGAVRIQLWDLATNAAGLRLDAIADGDITSLAFSSDGKTLASAAIGGDTTLWDLSTGMEIHSAFLKDTGSVAFSPDGSWLVSGSWQLTLRKTATYDEVEFELPDAPTHIGSVEFSPDGKSIASASSNGNVIVWDPETRTPIEQPFQLNIGSLNELEFSPDGRTLYAANNDGQVAIIALETAPLRRVVRTKDVVGDVAFSPSTGNLMAALYNAGIHVWDGATLKPHDAATQIDAAVFAINRSGDMIAVGDGKGRLSLLAANDLKPLFPPSQIAPERIDALEFSPDGSTLAIVALGREVIVWDVKQNQKYPMALSADSENVRAAVFTSDGERVVTVGDDGDIIQWKWRTAERVGTPAKLEEGADALAVSPDGTLLAVGGYDDRVTVRNLASGEASGVPLVGHTNIVRAVAFSPDGRFLASGADDGVAILWDVQTRLRVAEFRHGVTVYSGDGTAKTPRAVNQLAFSSDGKVLATDGPENEILLWDIDLESWTRQACARTNRNLTEEEWRRFIGETQALETCPVGRPRNQLSVDR